MRYAVILGLVLLTACGEKKENLLKTIQSVDNSQPLAARSVAVGRFAPRDECAKLPGAEDFRQRLVEAVQLRDANAFAALADPAIKLDFGGGGGVDGLRQTLGAGDELWKSLEQLLKLGCAADAHGNIVMPWLFAQDVGAIDPTAALLVTGEDVPVLSAPRAGAPPVTTISWNFVNALPDFVPGAAYRHVALPLKQDGYVASDKLRSVLDYRLLASRHGGQWRIDALVAGD
jgi:hypothetical protein